LESEIVKRRTKFKLDGIKVKADKLAEAIEVSGTVAEKIKNLEYDATFWLSKKYQALLKVLLPESESEKYQAFLFGVEKGKPSLICCGASEEEVFRIIIFSDFYNVAKGQARDNQSPEISSPSPRR